MDRVLHSWRLHCNLDRMWKILEDHLSWKVGEPALQSRTLMTKPATDVDKDGPFGVPASGFSLDRVHREPGGHSFTLLHHILLEVSEPFWILLKPNKGWHGDIPGWLKDAFGVVRDGLVLSFVEELG